MVLDRFKEENGWIISKWNLTYGTGWDGIIRGVSKIFPYYDHVEVQYGSATGSEMKPVTQSDLLHLEEGAALVVRGLSKIIKCPLSITFYNQTNVVEVAVPQTSEEFEHPTYESLSKSLGQYLDSVELYMLLDNQPKAEPRKKKGIASWFK